MLELLRDLMNPSQKPGRKVRPAHFTDEETEARGGEVTWPGYSDLDSILGLWVSQSQTFPMALPPC